MEYIFILKYQLSEQDRDHADIVERLGGGGCDDALAGIGLTGRIALEFTREAANAGAALLSALADVKRLLPGATLIEAAPDLVGLTDVADAVGMSRQNLRKLMLAYPGSFPAPVHEGSTVLWHLTDVLGWLKAKGPYPIAADVAEVARTTRQVNLARGAALVEPELQRQLRQLLA